MPIKKAYFYKCVLLLNIFLCVAILNCGSNTSVSINPNLAVVAQGCGNGVVERNEACDDGNIQNSDGCNSHCAWEVGKAICGNGILENEECCDDGNEADGDGCSVLCTFETPNTPPLAPVLNLPADNALFNPTRLYLSWQPSSDVEEDSVTYDVYFEKVNNATDPLPVSPPYRKGVAATHFIIQASTDNRPQYQPNGLHVDKPIYLEHDSHYVWKVCANDGRTNPLGITCSPERHFHTDHSVVGWWRFDEDLNGSSCPAALGDNSARSGNVGEIVCDYSGFGNHGVPSASLKTRERHDSVLGFEIPFSESDSNDYVTVRAAESLDFTTPKSLAFSFKGNTSSSNGVGISKGPFDTANYFLNVSQSNYLYDSGGHYIVSLSFKSSTSKPFFLNTNYNENPLLASYILTDLLMSFQFGDGNSVKTYFNNELATIEGFWLDLNTLDPSNIEMTATGNEPPVKNNQALILNGSGLVDEILLIVKDLSDEERLNLQMTRQ